MTAESSSRPGRWMAFLYGSAVYVVFLGTFLYAIGFVGNLVVPKSIDTGEVAPVSVAIPINVLLLVLFVIQHTVMARPGFKARWTRIVPKPIERSTFVLATSIVLILLFWQWRPMPQVVWSVDHPAGRVVLWGLFGAGWALVLYASFLIDHFDLFGLRQVYRHWRGLPHAHPVFVMPWLYKLIRNPLMLGFLIAFWSTPVMTQGHLLFSVLTTGYIFMGIAFEERDLLRMLGEDYRQYRARTPMLMPMPWRGPAGTPQRAADKAEAGT